MKRIEQLLSIMTNLRDKEKGCPWDLKQTPVSLKPYLLEEAYEVIEAIDDNNPEELKKELGDLLLQIVFHAQIAKENNLFDFGDVAQAISEKLILRHPHIFETEEQLSPEKVKQNWEMIKKEKEGKKRILDGIPKSFNALLRSLRIQEKAAAIGFEWPDTDGVVLKIHEELNELLVGLKNNDQKNIEEEIGDLFFVLVNLSKRCGINPEDALQKCNNKFINRFSYIEEKIEQNGEKISDKTLSELDLIWNEAKKVLKDNE